VLCAFVAPNIALDLDFKRVELLAQSRWVTRAPTQRRHWGCTVMSCSAKACRWLCWALYKLAVC